MTELSGALDGLGLPAIVRFLTSLRKTGWLRVGHAEWRGELFFENGRVVAAALGSRKGLSAIEALVQSLPEGEFTFTSTSEDVSPPEERNVDLMPDELQARLDDLAARAAQGAPSLPSPFAVPVLAADEDATDTADQLKLDRGTLQTLLAVDGRRTVRDIVSARSSFEALWQLAALAEMGVVRLGGPEQHTSPLAVGSVGEAAHARPVPPPLHSPLAVAPQAAEPDASVRCPMLGFEDDPKRALGRPTRLHRCFALGEPLSLPLDHQRELCLTPHFETCPRLVPGADVQSHVQRAEVAPQPNGRVLPVGSEPPSAPASVESAPRPAPTPMVMPAAMPARVLDNLRPRWPTIAVVVFALALVALLLVPRLLDSGEDAPPPAALPTTTAANDLNIAGARATQSPPIAAPPSQPAPAPARGAASSPPPTGLSGVIASTSGAALGAPSGQVLLDEHFADNQRGWLDAPTGPPGLGGGGYLLSARQPGQFVAVGVPLNDALRDVVVGATFHKVSGPAGGGFGLIIRDQGPDARDGQSQSGRYYVFEVGDKGEVGIWRREIDHWVDVLPWQASDAVHVGGAPNEMVVRAVGTQLSLVVNGTEVGSRVDNTLGAGRLGLFVGGDLNQIAVDHYWVQIP